MATWEEQTSPLVKFEASPTESFLSTPGDIYPPLFTASSTSASNTMNPMEIMTPPPFTEARGQPAALSSIVTSPDPAAISPDVADTASAPMTAPSPSSTERKPAKKRKSWGQVLPEPKTNLPPRKRAKTEDEKEQRRVERVLRNRRAAQSSRERKRQEVEALEQRNKELEARVLSIEKTNLLLLEELNKYRRTAGVVTRSSSPLDALPSNPVTLTSELFRSQDGHKSLIDQLMFTEPSHSTVNPSSLSPEATPHNGEQNQVESEQVHAEPAANESASPSSTHKPTTELTQRPAAMLCDLQCQQSVDLPRSWTASQISAAQLQAHLLILSALVSTCQRPLTQIAMSLKAGFSLPPTPSILKTIIWLVTRPRSSRRTRSTCPSSSTRTATEPPKTQRLQAGNTSQRKLNSVFTFPTLRITSLQKILTCSPILARPLQDATMEALRLVPESCDDRVGDSLTSNSVTRDGNTAQPEWLEGFQLPSREALLTLLWALRVEARKSNVDAGICNASNIIVYRNKFDRLSRKRQLEKNLCMLGEKRQRLG
ncbi:hypothetical protein jhhlp_000578 [Lomentospora prolificans]|uniref:BZIP domain-containing protein n=1 Tax=Lomentospora prolificans TaxID=41688 RepID=A0A2N3NIW6_9PEZI|nr:hypothetical protein jhhlp_000578 [Lomentospora prolificans]